MHLHTDSLKDAALKYAEKGWRVLPVREKGKAPLLNSWQNEASDDTDIVAQWWDHEYRNSNIGIACGHGLIVLDVDGETGEDTLACLELEHGPLPDTLECHTGTGRHLYFACEEPLRNTASTLGERLDTRGLGGQVVAPPSIHPNGALYRWANDLDPAPLPAWMLTLLEPPAYRNSAPPTGETFRLKPYEEQIQWTQIHPYDRDYFEQALNDLGRAQPGKRNDALNRLACDAGRLVASRFADPIFVEGSVKNAAHASGLEAREIENTWKSGYEKGLLDGTAWTHKPALITRPASTKPTRREGTLIMTRLSEAVVQPVSFLWGDRLQQNTINLISGDGGIGKSTMVMHIARSVTNPEENCALPNDFGQRVHGEVMLAAYEDSVARIQEQARVLGIDQRKMILLEGSRDFDDEIMPFCAADVPNLVAALEQMPNVRMLIIDPWTEFMTDNPNKEDTTRAAIKPLWTVAKDRQVTIIILAHTNKRSDAGSPTDRISGNSALKNRPRSVLMVREMEGGQCGVAHAKANSSQKAKTMLYRWNENARWSDGENPFTWDGTSEITATELFAMRGPTKVEEAESWLRSTLASGEMLANEIEALADDQGIKGASLKKAREHTCITRKDGLGAWQWRLK